MKSSLWNHWFSKYGFFSALMDYKIPMSFQKKKMEKKEEERKIITV